MNKLKVRANKSYRFGFVLTEQELRRFNDLILDQVKKDNQEEIQVSYSLIYENGVVAQTHDIEEVISQENSGSAKILELSILISSKDKREVRLEFANIDSENVTENSSIKYSINALTRDWVFITSSILDERIKKIKRFSVSNAIGRKGFRQIFTLVIPLLFLIAIMIPAINGATNTESEWDNIRSEWESKELTDPVEAIIRIQELNYSLKQFAGIKYVVFGIGIIILIMFSFSFYLQKFYPACNFCWGDYIEEFKRKESIRKTINIVIVIGLIVSVLGGIIADRIGA